MKNKTSYSRIIAGTMTWGSWGKKFSEKEMASLINSCIEYGITTFDHADIYGGYTNEADFGTAFSSSGIPRENIQLISKCGIQYVCEARNNLVKHYEYDSEYIVASAEQSLTNLKTEYLDLFLLHRPSPLMHPEEIATAIEKLKNEGKIRDFGVSNFTSSQIRLIETAIPVSGNQLEFSLTANRAMLNGMLDDCMINDRMAMSWRPLGIYFKEKTAQQKRIKKLMASLKEKYDINTSQLLLAWILKHPAKVYPVVGTTSPKRLHNAVKALDADLATEDWFQLLIASQGHKVP